MTCIVGLVSETGVCVGADSAGSDGWNIFTRSDPKLFERGPYLIGFTTSFRMGQLLQFAGTLPDPPEDPEALYGFMVVDFVNAVRDIFKAGGYAKKENEREEAGEFMIAVAGRLFVIYDTYQVAEHTAGISAIGSGYQVALGALWTARNCGASSYDAVLQALDAAQEWCASVRGPFKVIERSAPSKIVLPERLRVGIQPSTPWPNPPVDSWVTGSTYDLP